MYELSHKTRADSSAQDKERVYFTAHPEDFDVFFSEITDSILTYQNCAIFYDPDPLAVREAAEMDTELHRMQLFVIPVTARFLYTENRARCVEFAYAMEHHIPVLPLMQEGGLEEDFNRICGDLQFLDKNASSRDLTAIPYEEKLEKFLASVLLGDELAEKVRAAFDAYIFLSYRKKDRAYAQELMRLIHKNDFCRDIAIWYDEFLVPGENFNDAIGDALKRSRLFALVVTPSLLEKNAKGEGNYIMQVEYPAAIDPENPTPVLPAEMVATDRAAMEAHYKDIPPTVDAHQEVELSEALLTHLRDLAIRENDSDPQHNFFIGLAYLGGIDVEVDQERALRLITDAAEHGLPEAMEKLVQMYRGGEGVAREYEKAIEWQKRIVEERERVFGEEPTEENFDVLFSDLKNLGNYQKELARLADAKDTYIRMMQLCEEWKDSFDCRRNISISYEKLGNISRELGDHDRTHDYYRKALDISEILAKETNTVESRRDLAIGYSKMGNISQAQGDLSGARDYYTKALDIFEALARETNTVESRRDLSACYDRLGNIFDALGDLAGAREYFTKAFDIDEALARETNTVQTRRDLSISYERLGDISQSQGDLAGALDYYTKSLDIFEALARETNTVLFRRDLSISYDSLGDISKAQGDLAGARDYYTKSLAIAEALARETNTIKSRRDLSISYERLGDISQSQSDLAGARDFYTKSLDIFEALAKETNTVESRRDLSISYEKMGDISKALGDLAGARDYYMKAFDIRESLARETNTVESRRDLSISYNRLGDISKAQGDLVGAREYYTKSLDIFEALARETGTIEAWDDLAVSHYTLGNTFNDLASLRKALDIWTKLAENYPDIPRFKQNRDFLRMKLSEKF